MKTRNYWVEIEVLEEFTQQGHRLGIYECGICKNRYKIRVTSVKHDKSKMCKSCSCLRQHRHLWKIHTPDGKVITVKGLRAWSRANKIPYTTLHRSYSEGRVSQAGYLVEKISES